VSVSSVPLEQAQNSNGGAFVRRLITSALSVFLLASITTEAGGLDGKKAMEGLKL
jgi:hypothetical protein